MVSDPGSAIWIKHSDTADSSKFLAHGDRFFDNTIPLSKYRLNHIGRTYFLHITGTIHSRYILYFLHITGTI